MIDLGLWRAAIGRFHSACVAKFSLDRPGTEGSAARGDCVTVSVSGVFFSWICLLFMVCLVRSAKQIVENTVTAPFLLMGTVFEDTTGTLFGNTTITVFENTTLASGAFVTPSDIVSFPSLILASTAVVQYAPTLCFALFVFASRRVMLSGDVEKNPGPGGNKEEHKLEELVSLRGDIKQLEENLQKKLDGILNAMQLQADTLKRQEDLLRRFGAEQAELKKTVAGLCRDVNATERGVQKNEEAIIGLATKQDHMNKTVSDLEAEIDRLEGFSRRNNVKIFGIPESSQEEEKDCAESVRHVLATYIPEKTWDRDVIERAHRLGKPNPRNSNPRPIIAKFLRWGDAMRLMKDRGARADMGRDGLRAAQDLTKRQSARLRTLRQEGKVGYFVNGRLQIRDEQRRAAVDRQPSLSSNRDTASGPGSPGLLTSDVTQLPPDPDHGQPTSDVGIVTDVTATQSHEDGSGNPVLGDDCQRPRTRSATRHPRLNEMAWDRKDGAAAREEGGSQK